MNNFATSLAGLKERKGVLIALIAVILVPLIYAAIILTSSWGPYDNLSNLPVAVVNEDTGAMSGDEKVNVGEELVATLKEKKSLGFEYVSKDEAKKGLDDLKYYMVIEIPEDFSQNVTTVLTENPKIPELKFTQNQGLHFMAAQVTNKATEQIREELGNKITETYARSMFTQLEQVASGFQDGADGSTQLNDGAVKLKEGTGTILSSLESKSGDIDRLATGTTELKAGTGELLTSIQGGTSGVNQLADGAKAVAQGNGDLNDGILKANSGAKELKTGAQKLNGGAKDLNNGAKELKAGANKLKKGTGDVLIGLKAAKAGSTELNGAVKQLAPGSQQVADGIEQMAKHPLLGPLLATNQDFQRLREGSKSVANGLAAVAPGMEKVDGGLAALVNGQTEIDNGMGALVTGTTKLEGGSGQLLTGTNQLVAGTSQLSSGTSQLSDGSSKLVAGANKLSDGNASLKGSWGKLSDGAQKLNNGAGQINDGNQTVKTGWGTLTDGVKQVDDGIGQLEGGSKELATGLTGGAEKVSAIKADDANIAQFASPVKLNGEVINEYPMYRYANAPYVLSLALFVGVLALALLFDIRKPDDVEVSGIKWYSTVFSKMAGAAVLQAIIMSVFALFFIKLSVGNGILLVLFSVVASLAFLAIVFFLVALAGNIGRLIAVAFVVLQLSTTGSSLPIEMLPAGLRTLSNFLPMRYSIDSFKALISLDNTSAAWSNVTMLAIYLILALVLTAVVAVIHSRSSSQSSIEA